MSFGPSTDHLPSPPTKPLGTDRRRLSTHEQARPVPWFRGHKTDLGVTFISRFFDVRKAEQESESSKGGAAKTGVKYYASFAVLLGHGRLTRVAAIRLNGDLAWNDGVNFNGADYMDVALTGAGSGNWGNCRIYAGTETRQPDEYLISKSGVDHPAYRGFSYIVFKRLYLGLNQTNAPTVEVECYSTPEISWTAHEIAIGGGLLPAEGINPIALAAELLQHYRIGLAVPDAMLDTADLDATALLVKNEKIGVVAFEDRQQECRSLLVQALQYADAFPLIGGDGKFRVGLNRPAVDLNALPVVNTSVMTGPPDRTAGDWLAAHSETIVKHQHPSVVGLETASIWRDRGLLRITGEPNTVTADRSWIRTANLASNTRNALGRSNALPEATGSVGLRKTGTLFDDLAPGALFKLVYRGITQVCRVRERTEDSPGKPAFSISYAIDYSYLVNAGAVPDIDDYPPPPPPPDEFGEDNTLAYVRVVELPLALCPEGKLTLVPLVRRDADIHTGFSAYHHKNYDWDEDPPASYRRLLVSSRFALHGKLLEEFPADTNVVDETQGLLVELDGVDTAIGELTSFDATSDELLVFIGDEIFSIHRADLVAAGLYRIYTIRSRFTPPQAHAADAEVFILGRASVVASSLQHPHFRITNTARFKVTPIITGEADLASIDPIDLPIVGRMFENIAPINLRVNDALDDATYESGEGVTIDWTRPDAGNSINNREALRITTVVEFLDTDLNLLGTEEVAEHVEQLVLTNGELVAILGGEIDFVVRAKTQVDGDFFIRESSAPPTLEVTLT